MATLERAVVIAATAHAGQVDKAGMPYILHPLRVMLALSSLEERIVGVLHDLVEDTGWTLDDLRREGFAEAVVAAVAVDARGLAESYDDFVRRAARQPLGPRVKLADLADNLDLSRIAAPTARDHARLERYRRAVALIEGEAG